MSAQRPMPPFLPDAILPSQLPSPRGAAARPEVRLITAVFEDAFQVISQGAPAGSYARREREFIDACDWFLSDNRDWPFAFANVCELLGLDIQAVRQKVYALIMRRAREEKGRENQNEHAGDGHERSKDQPAQEPERRLEILGWDEV